MAGWRIQPGSSVDLSAIDPDSTPEAPVDKDATVDAFKVLRRELRDW